VLSVMTDIQRLLRHGMSVVTYDTSGLSRAAQQTVSYMMAAWSALIVGAVMLAFSCVYGLAVLLPMLPLWALFGGMGVLLLLGGGVLYIGARGKIGDLKDMGRQSSEAAESMSKVADHVNETIESAKEKISASAQSVSETVDSIKHATDLRLQVEERPLGMFAGSVAIGLVGGLIINASVPRAAHRNGVHHANGSRHTSEGPAPTDSTEEPGMLARVGELFGPQAGMLREMAVGTLFGLARDWAREGVSKQFEQPVSDFFDRASTQMGGKNMPPGQFKPGNRAEAEAVANPNQNHQSATHR